MDVFTPLIKPVLLRLLAETHFSYMTRSVRSYLHLTQVYLTSINAVFLSTISDFSENPMRDARHVRNGATERL